MALLFFFLRGLLIIAGVLALNLAAVGVFKEVIGYIHKGHILTASQVFLLIYTLSEINKS